MQIGIDASNIGLGGGVTHLIEILSHFPLNQGIDKVIVFASNKVLNQLPDSEYIQKITFPAFNKRLIHRVLFQIFVYDKHIKHHCDILFSVTGDYFGKFKPLVGMSQNMLLYERDIWRDIKQPKEIIRFWLNYHKQKRCFKNANGIIFISQYARDFISKKLNLRNKHVVVIHHGISPRFQTELKKQLPIKDYSRENTFKLLYVSTVHVYKHQWNVVEAIDRLRKKGFPLELDLVGGIIFKPAGEKLYNAIMQTDPQDEFIHYYDQVSYNQIDKFYKNANGFVYASTCENMPNILIESMASGLPIVCSDKQPMPEFLGKNGFYFNAKSVDSIVDAIERMLLNPTERYNTTSNNQKAVKKYSWELTAKKTFLFIKEIYMQHYDI